MESLDAAAARRGAYRSTKPPTAVPWWSYYRMKETTRYFWENAVIEPRSLCPIGQQASMVANLLPNSIHAMVQYGQETSSIKVRPC